MKKFLITLFIGVAFIGLGAGYSTVELTALEARPYNPVETTTSMSNYSRSFMSESLLNREEVEINAGTYMTRLQLVEDETMEEGMIAFEAEYPKDIIDISSFDRRDGYTVYAHTRDSFVFSALQQGFKGLKQKTVYYPNFDDFTVTIKVKVSPASAKYVDMNYYYHY